jgi:hypothetical protein
VTAKQRAQSGVDVEDADIALAQTVADIGLVDGNLAAEDEVWIGLVLGDGSDLQLGLGLPFQPHVDVVDHAVAAQVPALGELTARHPNRRRRHQIHDRRRGGRGGRVGWGRRRGLIGVEKGHEAGPRVRVRVSRRRDWGLERRCGVGEGALVVQRWVLGLRMVRVVVIWAGLKRCRLGRVGVGARGRRKWGRSV